MADLLPQYEMHAVIGVGGMGAVYKGRQAALDRWVAIKLLPVSAAQNAEDAQRFIKEARSMARLVHPHIVAVFDFGQTRDGHLYLVMEYVEGSDLHRRTRAREVTTERARQVIFQICDALQFAHDRGVIHRDIKPANILITDQWQAKLADFGLARELSGIPNSDEPEYGTPDYTAPERLIVGAVVDHRADIYALGVVMHEMLTGKTPHALGTEAGKGLPQEFATVVSRCLLPNPDRRFQRAAEIKTALLEALAEKRRQESAPESPVPAPEVTRPPQRAPALESVKQALGPVLWGLASVILVVGLGWLVVLNRLRQQEDVGGASPQNTTVGAGTLAVFAPPLAEESEKPAVPAPPPATTPTPIPAPPPAMVAKTPPKEIEEPMVALPTVPLDQPYQVDDGEPGEIARLKGHKDSVYSIKLMRDQRRIVSGSSDGTVRIWDVMTRSELLRLDPGVGAVSRLVLNADESLALVSSVTTDRLALLDLTSGKVTASVAMPNDRLYPVTFAPDGRTVLAGTTATAGPTLFRWDPATDAAPEPVTGVESWIHELIALPGEPKGRVFLSCSLPMEADSKIKGRRGATLILDTNTGAVTPFTGPMGGTRMSFSKDGTRMLLLGSSMTILSLPDLKVAHSIPIPTGTIRPYTIAFAGDNRVASVWGDETLRLFDVATGQEVYQGAINHRAADLAVSQDGRWAVISSSRLTKDAPREGDFDLILWRLPKPTKPLSDQAVETLARQQMDDLPKNDPELAKLRDALPKTIKLPPPVDKTAQLLTLNAQYIAALRRTAQS
ncbi:MAG: serine/threonine-protein kinase, partial [Prosthecobacter sp.]|nr:serine/threonine-protein kinase [Prosthecobacter sp.]